MRLRVWLAVALVGFSSVAVAQSFLSPGPVGRSHAKWGSDCDTCHEPYKGVTDARCLDCHADLGERIQAGRGFHADQSAPCTECHSDHNGARASLTTDAARAAFDHGLTGFSLSGAHAPLERTCQSCHDTPLGELSSDCSACHISDNPHERSAAPPDKDHGLGEACESCHVVQTWMSTKSLSEHRVSMRGKHARLADPGSFTGVHRPDQLMGDFACKSCHTGGEDLLFEQSCANCHEQAHGGTTAPCEQCHTVDGFLPAEFNHGPCGCTFPGAHQTVDCVECHTAPDGELRFTDTSSLCSSCHTDDLGHDNIGECSVCHTAARASVQSAWVPAQHNHNRAGSPFPLRGKHLQVDCEGCHTEPGVFGGLPTDCASCHTDTHGQQAHGRALEDFPACGDCHTPAGFSDSRFDHATQTRFPLTGSHTDLSCASCHPDKTSLP